MTMSAIDIRALVEEAKAGDVMAQFNLGVAYRDGKDVTQDYKQAFEYFKKAADHGDVTAQCNLGCVLEMAKR